jgi:hypothetical protein
VLQIIIRPIQHPVNMPAGENSQSQVLRAWPWHRLAKQASAPPNKN